VSRKDRVLLAGSPHLVLDGLSIAAETVGAAEAILCIDRSATTALSVVGTALRERDRAGADHIPIRLEATPGPYVTGEESALVHWINGGEAKPTFVPPRPYERGVKGRPTLVNNVETLANLALIARFRAEWFRGLGTAKDPGSVLITVSGDVGRAGVYEVSLGSGLSSVVRSAELNGKPKALLVGGYSGIWIDAGGADKLTLDSVSLATVKAAVGCGAVSVLGPDACGLMETASIARWLADQSAGQCGPCVHGLPAIAQELDVLVAGDRRGTARRRLAQLLDVVAGRGACHHPDGAVKMVRSALAVFAGEIETHRRHGPCRVRRPVLPVPARSAGWR
jgi:NADH:ubiquinone oxidoreductase subunit F (NADH-binding)